MEVMRSRLPGMRQVPRWTKVIAGSVPREPDTTTRGTQEGRESGAEPQVARLPYPPDKAVLVLFMNMKNSGQRSFLNPQGHFDKFLVVTPNMTKRIPSPL